MYIPHEILIPTIANVVSEGNTVTLPLKGFSMRPYLENDRDKALLAAPPEKLNIGDVILAEIAPKRYALHRIVEIKGDNITMYGDGNFTPEHIKRKDVMAIAIGFYRKGRNRLERCDTLSYSIYWKTWVKLRPMRRYLLTIWKLVHYPKETLKTIIAKLCMQTKNSNSKKS